MEIIAIHYFENADGTYDTYCDGQLLVKDAKSYIHAKVISEILLSEEHKEFAVNMEIVTYYRRSEV